MAAPTHGIRLFVLYAWHPALGMPAAPVGVLGVAGRPGEAPLSYVSWIPLPGDVARPWQARLTRPLTDEVLSTWLAAEGTLQLAEVPVGPEVPGTDLARAVETVTDALLAEVVPYLPAFPPGAA